MPYSNYEEKYNRKKQISSPIVVVRVWMVFMAMIAGIIFVPFITKYLNQAFYLVHDGPIRQATPRSFAPVHTKLMFVTAWIDLGPEHKEKTPASRLEHFKRLASSGISIFVFASPSNVAVMEEVRTEFPNIVGLRSVEMDDLQSVQTIRSFIDLRLPASLNNNKDTQRFLELMLAKIDFVYQALAYTDATHLAWIDFNIAHVFDDSVIALNALHDLQQRDLVPCFLTFPVIWDRSNISMEDLIERVNWRFAGGLFLGDRYSLEQWYNLCSDTLRLFLAQTQTLVWEVNFWAWLENVYPNSFHPQVYTSDHDNSLVVIPTTMFGNV
jgi:hypothetical protein